MLRRPELHSLTGVYAVDATSYAERDRFEHHLRHCAVCAKEARGLRATAARIGLSAAVPPPDRLRERVLAAVASPRQLPPLPEEPPARERRPRLPRTSWYPRLATAVAVACLAAVVVLGMLQFRTQHQLGQARGRGQSVAAVLAAPDARLITQATAAGGRATVVVSAARHQLVVTTSGLPALPPSKVYELWLMSPGRATPCGLLTLAADGTSDPVLASGLAPGQRLGLTVEPHGGTARPTTRPILDLPLR